MGLQLSITNSASSHSESCSGLPIVAERPIIWISLSIFLRIVMSISNVGPLFGSFSRWISSTITRPMLLSQGALCLINESNFSLVVIIKS